MLLIHKFTFILDVVQLWARLMQLLVFNILLQIVACYHKHIQASLIHIISFDLNTCLAYTHIPQIVFHECTYPQSRVSVEKDYYDSKLMLHWSDICTFAGCFHRGMVFLAFILSMMAVTVGFAVQSNYH